MTYILLIVLIALVGYNIFLNIQQKRKREKEELERELERKRQELLQQAALQEATKKPEEQPVVPACQLIKDLLGKLNCEVEVKATQHNKELLEFSYQGGHFSVAASTQEGSFRLGYMFFFSTTPQNLEQVRNLVNRLNNQTQLTRFTYTFVEQENQVFVHQILSSMLVAGMPELESYWKVLLDSCFEHRQIFIQEFGKMNKKSDEIAQMDESRMLFLLREHEIANQEYDRRTRMSEELPFSLKDFLATCLEMPDATPTKLKIVTDQLEIITEQKVIEEYQLQHPLIEGQGKEAHFIKQDAELVLTFTDPSQKNRPLTIALTLHAEKKTEQALYFRVSFCIPVRSISKDWSFMARGNMVDAQSLLLAYDKQDWNEKRTEAEYMWKDALEKANNNQDKELSKEQEMLMSSTFTNDAYALYWGRKAFMGRRYYEAIFYLKQVHASLQAAFHELSKNDIKIFFEVCYYLGFSYDALNQHEKANYYLTIVFQLNRVNYAEEYLYGLVKMGDFRALPTIDAILEHMQRAEEQTNEDDEDSDDLGFTPTNPSIQAFRYFLLQRKAYILEEREEWEEAEKLYKELLEDPQQEELALNALARLQNRRKQEEKAE